MSNRKGCLSLLADRWQGVLLAGAVLSVILSLLLPLAANQTAVSAKTAPVPASVILEGQAGTAVLFFDGASGARTAVFLDAPIPGMIPVCSPSDEWAIGVAVGCQPLGDSTIGITAQLPYTTTHTLMVYWIAVEGTMGTAVEEK